MVVVNDLGKAIDGYIFSGHGDLRGRRVINKSQIIECHPPLLENTSEIIQLTEANQTMQPKRTRHDFDDDIPF
jgi:hypothetical protein